MAHIDGSETRRGNLSFIKSAMREPLLTRERELDLARRWRDLDDETALHELVRSYTRLVISTASRFRNYGLPMGDLVQEGNVGLMQAAARFEPSREVRFSTYATWWIRSAIQDFVLRNWSIVRTGTTAAQKSLFFNLRRLQARIQDASSARLTHDGRAKVAKALNVRIGDVESMEVRMAGGDMSLNMPMTPTGDVDWQDSLADERPSPEDVVIGMRDSVTRSRWLAEAIGQLTAREQTIIRRRRMREDGETLEKLGERLGVSKERIRQLEHRAMLKMRNFLQKRVRTTDELLIGR